MATIDDVERFVEQMLAGLSDHPAYYAHKLLDHLHHVPSGQLWVHCATGYRAAIAASLLARAGYDVVLVDGDFTDAKGAGLPVVD